jgi:hypothetical protein
MQAATFSEKQIQALLTGEGALAGNVEKKGMLPVRKWCAMSEALVACMECIHPHACRSTGNLLACPCMGRMRGRHAHVVAVACIHQFTCVRLVP